MKKYWKSILICICLAVAVFIGVKGCKIEVPKDNTTVESSVENSSANEEKEYSTKVEKRYVTISIRCDTILNNMDKFNMDKKDYINNGVILSSTKIELAESDKTVFDILYRVTRGKRIPIDYSGNKESAYIKGINHIYEFDCGKQSGWMYRINGIFPNYGVGHYKLNGGENIEVLYTCDLGYDIGGGY